MAAGTLNSVDYVRRVKNFLALAAYDISFNQVGIAVIIPQIFMYVFLVGA